MMRINLTSKKEIPLYLLIIAVIIKEIIIASSSGFFVDEFFNWAVVNRPLHQLFLIKQFVRWYMNSFPPMYEVIVHYFALLTSCTSVLALRMPAIISFGVVIFLMYKFTLLLSGDRRASFLSSLFIAVYPIYFLYGHMLSGYMFFTACSLLSCYVIYLFFFSGYRKKYLLFLFILHIVMLYVSYLSFFIIGFQLLFLRIHLDSAERKDLIFFLWIAGIIYLGVFMPWFPNFVFDVQLEFINKKAASLFLLDRNIITVAKSLFSRGGLLFLLNSLLFIVSSIKISGFYSQHKVKRVFLSFIIYFYIVYIAGVLLINKDFSNMFGWRSGFMRYMLPAFSVVLVVNAIFISAFIRNKAIVFCVAAFFIIFSILCHRNIPTIKPVAEYLKEIIPEGNNTLLLFEDTLDIPGFLYYFSSPADALAATEKYYGNIYSGTQEKFRKKGIDIIGNIVGISYYVHRQALMSNNYSRVIIVDLPYFCCPYMNSCNCDCTRNFVYSIDVLIKKLSFPYHLKSKRHFPYYSVWIYSNEDKLRNSPAG